MDTTLAETIATLSGYFSDDALKAIAANGHMAGTREVEMLAKLVMSLRTAQNNNNTTTNAQ